MLKRLGKIVGLLVVIVILAVIGFTVWASNKYVVPIMMYHNINDDEPLDNTVSPKSFAIQMKYLKDHGYHVLSLDELVQATIKNTALPKNSVVITFDDGYEDNYKNAYPILKFNGFTATFFIISNMPGKEGFMTWNEIKEMEKGGMSIGSHTVNHPYLPAIDRIEQREELELSKKTIEAKLGHRIDYLAYPTGGYNSAIKKMTRKAGYVGACTTNRGYDRFNKDVYALKRIRFNNDETYSLVLWAKLSGYYNLFRKPKKPT